MLIIHIGMPKTGSSYLQGMAAQNRSALKEVGVIYPQGREEAAALSARINSGNGHSLGTLTPTKDLTYLVSSELFFYDFDTVKAHALSALNAGVPVRLIMFIRDVLPYLTSGWQQDIKRGGLHGIGIDEYVQTHARQWLALVLRWLRFGVVSGVELRVVNYSRHKKQLANAFFRQCVGIDNISRLQKPSARPINRSLSSSELALQELANKYLGKNSSSYVSDVLVNECPFISSSVIRPSQDVALTVKRNINPLLLQVNKYLPPSQHLRFDGEDVMERGEELRIDEPLTFSRPQVESLFRHLKQSLKRQ